MIGQRDLLNESLREIYYKLSLKVMMMTYEIDE